MNVQTARKIIPFQPKTHEVPYSQEAEEALVGAALISPESFEACREIVAPEDFFFLRHSHIWKAMDTARERNYPIGDVVGLCEILKEHGHLDDIGGPAFITQLIRNTPSSLHAEFYAGMVQRQAIRRRLIQQFDEAQQTATDGTEPTEILGDHIQHMLDTYQTLHTPTVERAGLSDLDNYFSIVREAMENPEGARGVPTGFAALDGLVSGWHKSKLAVVGGLTHMGKTGTMMSLTLNAAKQGFPVAYFNVADGTKADVIGRMIAALSGVPSIDQITGQLPPAKFTRYMAGHEQFAELPIYITDQYGMTPREIALSARAMRDQFGIRLVVIDYFQRMGIEGDYPNRLKELEKISSLLVDMAKRLNLPVIVGAQVGHHVTERRDKRPTLSDIKDCKAMAENADVVVFVHRESVFDEHCEFPNSVELIVAKNKVSGRAGTVQVYIDKTTGAILPGTIHEGPKPDDTPF